MTKERVLFLLFLLSFFIYKNLDFNSNSQWIESEKESYLTTGHYSLSKITQKEIESIEKISKNDAILIMLNKENIKKYKKFDFIKGIGKKKDKILKKYIIIK